MKPIAAIRLPLDADLSDFVRLLQRLQVPHRVSEDAGEQVLWVPNQEYADGVQRLYERYPQGGDIKDLPPELAAPPGGGIVARLRASPITGLVLLATFIAAALTLLGTHHEAIHWLSFQDYRVQGDYAYFVPLQQSLDAGQWWRMFTPMFIHFGWLHLAMNSLWYWELGRRIEARQGGITLLGLTLLFSLLSNVAQFQFSDTGIFGGLSGVLYGLLGYCWIFQLLAPNPAYRLPPGVLVMMLIWLVVCLSGAIDLLGFGAIANAAHVGGLGAGCAAGLIGGLLARVNLGKRPG